MRWLRDAAYATAALFTGYLITDAIQRKADEKVCATFHDQLHSQTSVGYPFWWER